MLERLLTARAGWTVAVAVAVLILLGRVKPVRAGRSFTRQVVEKLGILPTRPEPLSGTHRLAVAHYRPPSLLRRASSTVGIGVMSVVVGVLVALVVGGSAIWLFTSLSGRLK